MLSSVDSVLMRVLIHLPLEADYNKFALQYSASPRQMGATKYNEVRQPIESFQCSLLTEALSSQLFVPMDMHYL